MKKFLFLLLGIFVTVFLFTGCVNNSEYGSGYVNSGVYLNDDLGIKYTPSDDMIIVKDESRHVGAGISSNETWQEFCGVIPKQDKSVKSVTIYSTTGYDDESEEKLVKSYVKNIKTSKTTYDKYKIGNTEFTKVSNLKDGDVVLLKKRFDAFVEIRIKNFSAEEVNEVLSRFSEW